MATVRAPNPPARLNRTLLALVGLLLLAAGAGGLAVGFGLLPAVDPNRPLVPAAIALAGWAPYAAVVGGVVLGLLVLRWLLAQAHRRPSGGVWELGGTALPTSAAAAAVAQDITAYRGVSAATATLSGPPTAPTLHLDVAVATDASVAGLRHRIAAEALPRLRGALELDDLPAQLVLRLDAHDAAQRVS
jgi:hypothetical protein